MEPQWSLASQVQRRYEQARCRRGQPVFTFKRCYPICTFCQSEISAWCCQAVKRNVKLKLSRQANNQTGSPFLQGRRFPCEPHPSAPRITPSDGFPRQALWRAHLWLGRLRGRLYGSSIVRSSGRSIPGLHPFSEMAAETPGLDLQGCFVIGG